MKKLLAKIDWGAVLTVFFGLLALYDVSLARYHFDTGNPFVFACSSVGIFAIGVWTGYWFHSKKLHKEKEETLRARVHFFSDMPPIHKGVLRAMYENGGTGYYSVIDPSIDYLSQFGVVGWPRVADTSTLTLFSIRPKQMQFIKEHESEIW